MLVILSNPAVRQAAMKVAATIGLSALSAVTQHVVARQLAKAAKREASSAQQMIDAKTSLALALSAERKISFQEATALPEFAQACQALDRALQPLTVAPAPEAVAA